MCALRSCAETRCKPSALGNRKPKNLASLTCTHTAKQSKCPANACTIYIDYLRLAFNRPCRPSRRGATGALRLFAGIPVATHSQWIQLHTQLHTQTSFVITGPAGSTSRSEQPVAALAGIILCTYLIICLFCPSSRCLLCNFSPFREQPFAKLLGNSDGVLDSLCVDHNTLITDIWKLVCGL